MVRVIPGFGSAVSVIGYCSGLGVQTVVCMFMVGDASVLTFRQEEGWGHWQYFNFVWVKSCFGCLESVVFWKSEMTTWYIFVDMMAPEKWEQFKNDVLFKNPLWFSKFTSTIFSWASWRAFVRNPGSFPGTKCADGKHPPSTGGKETWQLR